MGGTIKQVAADSVTDVIIDVCRENQITVVCMGQPSFSMPNVLFSIGRYRKFMKALAEMRIDLIIIS